MDILDLDGIAEKGTGFQATSGATGFGLPAVAVQWLEGAGDGALYRRTRILARDIDLPLEIFARDRRHLQTLLSRLALALAGECSLILQDDTGAQWSTTVRRVGGGEAAYGVDTTGEREWRSVITLRAGDPYWTSSQSQSRTIGSAGTAGFLSNLVRLKVTSSQAIGQITLTNDGDADAYPVWEVHGPGADFEAVSPAGERLKWVGNLAAGETLTLDTRRGTVVDQSGANRYSQLAPAPRFWTVRPGTSVAVASLNGVDTSSKIVCSWRPRKWMVV
ncbi:phage tail family protein [Streptomyces sp. NPDC005963]|uniref:phage tail family protein n=1 Tax=Streptomyces sp. NPDC005963 TaxID=3156721 RepID=UPI0033D74C59